MMPITIRKKTGATIANSTAATPRRRPTGRRRNFPCMLDRDAFMATSLAANVRRAAASS
jgi:hypothetical protein